MRPAPLEAPDAERLAEHDDTILAALVDDDRIPDQAELRAALTRQTALARTCPVYFGSAITGVGVAELIDGVRELLPHAVGDVYAETRGTVFAIERGRAGEKTAYVRLRDGVLRTRDRTAFGTITALEVVGLPPG